jgi:hypothetical protein
MNSLDGLFTSLIDDWAMGYHVALRFDLIKPESYHNMRLALEEAHF